MDSYAKEVGTTSVMRKLKTARKTGERLRLKLGSVGSVLYQKLAKDVVGWFAQEHAET